MIFKKLFRFWYNLEKLVSSYYILKLTVLKLFYFKLRVHRQVPSFQYFKELVITNRSLCLVSMIDTTILHTVLKY